MNGNGDVYKLEAGRPCHEGAFQILRQRGAAWWSSGRADPVMNVSHQLNYASPPIRVGHSAYGIASVCLALAIFLFSLVVLFLGDPFDSDFNSKPVRIGITAGILGMLLAVRALQDPNKKLILAQTGLLLNCLAILSVWNFLPCLQ